MGMRNRRTCQQTFAFVQEGDGISTQWWENRNNKTNQPALERLCKSKEPWNNGQLPHILLFWTHALENTPHPESGWLAHLTAGIKDTLFSRRDSPGERKPPKHKS